MLLGAFCFIFSCLSFSSELSVKEVAKTQQSEPSVREAPEKEKENDLPLLTDKEFNEILNSLTPPSYYNFKRVLEYMEIASLKEYLDFLEELEIEHFPKSPKKYYGNQWEDWPQKKLGDSTNSDKTIDFIVNRIIALERNEAVDLNRNDKFISYDTSPAMRHTVSPKSYNKNATPIIGNKKKNWMPFEEAQAVVQKAGIKTLAEFREWSKMRRPPNFPSEPHIKYKEDWVSWPHFFGTKTYDAKTEWMEFKEAQVVVQEAGIKTFVEFREWIKAGKKPPNFPSAPNQKYAEDWVSWRHFFGTEGQSRKKWMSFAEAQAVVQKAGIKTQAEFREWSKAGNRPAHFPSDPRRIYKKDWVSWYHFLGTEKCKKAFK